MSVYISILLLILSLIFKKSKTIAVLFFWFMWTLWGWNSWNGDYDAYELSYNNSKFKNDSTDFEPGFSLLNKFFYNIGFDFQDYMISLSFVVLFFVMIFAFKYSKFPALFSGLYFIIFIMEFVFTRNYLVHSIMLFAFLLVFDRVKYYKLYFFIIVAICFTLHSTAIMFLVFMLSFYTEKIFNLKKALYLFFVLVLLSIFLFNLVVIPILGEQLLGKLGFYSTGGGFSNVFFAHLIIVLLVYYFLTLALDSDKGELNDSIKRVYIIVININILSLSFLSLYYHVPYFSRILRFIFTFDIVFLLSAIYYVNDLKLKKRLYLVFSLVFFFVIIMFLKSTLSLTLYPLYKSNLIWGVEYYVPDFDYDK